MCEGIDKDDKQQVVTEAASRLIEAYRRRLAYGESSNDEAMRMQELARAEQAAPEALNAERDELFRRRISGELDDAIHLRLLHGNRLAGSDIGRIETIPLPFQAMLTGNLHGKECKF